MITRKNQGIIHLGTIIIIGIIVLLVASAAAYYFLNGRSGKLPSYQYDSSYTAPTVSESDDTTAIESEINQTSEGTVDEDFKELDAASSGL